MSLEQGTLERIGREFAESEQAAVADLLSCYCGPEADRVRRNILELSKGDLEKVRDYVDAARIDYRDVLYWAEYFHNDPMMGGRDPKKVVEEILAKWGDTKA